MIHSLRDSRFSHFPKDIAAFINLTTSKHFDSLEIEENCDVMCFNYCLQITRLIKKLMNEMTSQRDISPGFNVLVFYKVLFQSNLLVNTNTTGLQMYESSYFLSL